MSVVRVCSVIVAPTLAILSAACTQPSAPTSNKEHLSPMAWTGAQWRERCRDVRTSYNPDADLTDSTLTLVPGDPRWLDFVYWALNNKIAEHQVEAYGGTGWNGPEGGVIFHWAPGSHWERDTLASFGFTIGHIAGEHRWTDTMFPDFFEKHGGVYGISVKDRLSEIGPNSQDIWSEFLEYGGGERSPYYRYLFHREAVIDPVARKIYLLGGHGVAFSYTFERYYHEVREVLTDCRAIDFFEMYDLLGPGFAARGNWARQNPPPGDVQRVGYAVDEGAPPATAEASRYDPNPPPIPVPPDLPDADAMRHGQRVYLAQCAVCHGVRGDGKGFLASGFDVMPRDFQRGTYKFRTTATGELPTIEDIERAVSRGVERSSMPSWSQFLTTQEIQDVSRYLVVFSPRFVEAWRVGERAPLLTISPRPPDLTALVSKGAEIYQTLQCQACHGELGRGDGPSAPTLRNDWDQPIAAADLTYKWSFKNGHEPEDIYRTMIGGLNGTPMPSYDSALPDETDRWALVAHILSLSPAERPALHVVDFATQRQQRIGPDGRVLPSATPRHGGATLANVGGAGNACTCSQRIEP